jgi:hypothetical protein
MFGVVRTLAAIEEHGQGRQFTRVRAWPILSGGAVSLMILFGALALEAMIEHRWWIGAAMSIVSAVVAWRAVFECANAMCAVLRALDGLGMKRDGRSAR